MRRLMSVEWDDRWWTERNSHVHVQVPRIAGAVVLAPAVDHLLAILQRAPLLASILHAVLSYLIKSAFHQLTFQSTN